eukprot:scaffold248491_cov93-Cyclotella_meneghiniana.AAC.1
MEDQDDNGHQPLALESLDDYIRRRGIENVVVDRNGEFNGLTRDEAARQIDAENTYLDSVISKHLQECTEEDDKETSYDADYQQSDAEDEAVILLILANDTTHTARVKPLVSLCETVRRAVISRSRFSVPKSDIQTQNSGETSKQVKGKGHILELSLMEFDEMAVLQFIDVVVSLFHHMSSCEDNVTESETTLISRKRRIITDKTQDNQNQHALYLIQHKITEQHIVECLRISHYLQCSVMLEVLASVLEESIDSHNCMSICSLADLYNLQSLFEASVNHVVGRLDALQGKQNGDNNDEVNDKEDPSEDDRMQQEIWKSLPHELRSRILTMRNVMRSSVIGRGSKVSGVFFSNGDEFLAIFRETLCDLRERLSEARERRAEVIHEREVEWEIRRRRRGSWFDSSEEAKCSFVYSGDVQYAMAKIQKQDQRIKTLETFYDEQKLIFQSCSLGASNIVL